MIKKEIEMSTRTLRLHTVAVLAALVLLGGLAVQPALARQGGDDKSGKKKGD